MIHSSDSESLIAMSQIYYVLLFSCRHSRTSFHKIIRRRFSLLTWNMKAGEYLYEYKRDNYNVIVKVTGMLLLFNKCASSKLRYLILSHKI